MSDTHKFDFREWLVPPVLVPLFFGLLIAVLVVFRSKFAAVTCRHDWNLHERTAGNAEESP